MRENLNCHHRHAAAFPDLFLNERGWLKLFIQILAILALVSGSFVSTHSAHANAGVTRYVDPIHGYDSLNDCTQNSAPCQTIAKALSAANASGDTISLAAGIYKEHALFITKNLEITFPGPYMACLPPLVCSATVDGQKADRIFYIYPGAIVSMSHIIIQNGWIESGAQGGAGIFIYPDGSLSLDTVILRNNRIHRDTGQWSNRDIGAAVYNGGSLTIVNSAITQNVSDYSGGGIASYGPALSIIKTRIANNVAADGQAGGLLVTTTQVGPNLYLDQVTVDGNIALNGAGIVSNIPAVYSSLVITNSTISNNQATNGDGGGMTLYGQVSLSNVTISDNQASGLGQKGGFYLEEGAQGSFDHVTVAGNTPYGGGSEGDIQLQISNSILVGDGITQTTCQFYHGVTIISRGRNILTDTTCMPAAGNIVTQDPKLGPLASYGGSTMTRALLAGSPAINAAISISSPAEPALDQRGFARQGFAPDSGAFEDLEPAWVLAAFQPPLSRPGQQVDLVITLFNNNNAPALLDGLSFALNLPAGLTVAGVPTDPPNPCSGSLDAPVNGSMINFSAGGLEAGAPPPSECKIHIQVKAASMGKFTVTVPPISSSTTDALTNEVQAILVAIYPIYLPHVVR
jgi:hypothetical protein